MLEIGPEIWFIGFASIGVYVAARVLMWAALRVADALYWFLEG